jgi:5-methylthioadenosine/S-adenosylhomocysteine deaminase
MDAGTAWQAMKEFGLRGLAYQEVFGPHPDLARQQLDELRGKVSALRREETETLRAGVSPHAPYTVSAGLFAAVRDYARLESLRLTIHAAESKEEGMFVRAAAGPFAESLAERGIPVSPAGLTPISYLDNLDLLGPGTLLVHAIDVEDGDLKILAGRRPAIVHCPKSNAKLAHGIARVAEMLEAGLTVGLGTDSVASNNAVDMFEEMRCAIFQQRARAGRVGALDARTAFRMATIGGAECLGLAGLLGSLEPGKRADFAVVDLNDAALQPVYDPIETMVYSASRHNVRSTYIGGQEVQVDAGEMIRQAAQIAGRLRSL